MTDKYAYFDALAAEDDIHRERIAQRHAEARSHLANASLEDLVAEVNRRLATLKDGDMRLDVIGQVAEGYCRDCGWPENGQTCFCTRED